MVVSDKILAEDIAQEAFAELWEKREMFEEEGYAKAFMYTVVRHKALNHQRHQKVRQISAPNLVGPEIDDNNRLNELIKAEVLGAIHTAIQTLPNGCRQVFEMAYFEGLKNQEIADQLRVSINTVKTQKARAIQLLRLKIDPSILTLYLTILSMNGLLNF